jgi:hypothetical protein
MERCPSYSQRTAEKRAHCRDRVRQASTAMPRSVSDVFPPCGCDPFHPFDRQPDTVSSGCMLFPYYGQDPDKARVT